MSIRMIAQELYEALRTVDRLEAALREAPPQPQSALQEELRKARAARDRLRRILDGRKDDRR